MDPHIKEIWIAVLCALIHDLFVIYILGLFIGLIVALFRWGNSKKSFLELMAPAFIWPLALIKESWKYLKK